MGITIHHFESGNTETWIEVNDDGTVTRHQENSGWTMSRKGAQEREETLSADAAKLRWPNHAAAIDGALKRLRGDAP